MSDRSTLLARHRPGTWAAALAAVTLALAACSSASPSQSSAPSESQAASQPASESSAPSESAAPSESQGVARCGVSADATAAATIEMTGFAFGSEATVSVGQAVEFHNADGVAHTVTEGTTGVAVDGTCVDKSLGGGARTVVIFNEAGDYPITCRIHTGMQTTVHVQ